MFKKLRNERGFTLIELLIVIVIIGILAMIVVGYTGNSKKKATDTQKKTDMADLKKALESYFVENNNYPDATGWQDTLVTDKFIKAKKVAPNSAVNGDYTYTPTGSPATSYVLTVKLENPTDKDTNNVNGTYTLINNQ